MKYIAIFLCIVGLTMAADYTSDQQATLDGLRLSYQIGQAYEKYLQRGDATTFNALVDQWNAWVQTNFGQDANLLMSKVTGPVDLTKPYLLANNTTQGGIVHAIDGTGKAKGASYTTNDVNMLPKGVDPTKAKTANPWQQGGEEYLGGI
ncbi:MAG: hypothetical protein QG575_355 [Euryarchaeota archaeon]|nr:hypothetical protein [Euryarchaeota archaeon]